MTQRWERLGHVFVADGQQDWLAGYAAVPFVDWIDDRHARIYFSSRDVRNRSYTGWIVVDMADPLTPLELASRPALAPAGVGYFDEDGAMGSDLVQVGDAKYLYYIGWNVGRSVPFRNAIGVAVSHDDGNTFQRLSDGPILDRSIHDPCFVASHCVLREGELFRMWYLSCVEWSRLPDGAFRHRYHIKYAESANGIDWLRDGTVAVPFAYPNEYAISVPRVVHENGRYKMWYSYRGGPRAELYRIGYAESPDGRLFERRDLEVDLEPEPGAWDGEMVCYPCVFDWAGDRYLLYNGDGYGRTGFGLAVLRS